LPRGVVNRGSSPFYTKRKETSGDKKDDRKAESDGKWVCEVRQGEKKRYDPTGFDGPVKRCAKRKSGYLLVGDVNKHSKSCQKGKNLRILHFGGEMNAAEIDRIMVSPPCRKLTENPRPDCATSTSVSYVGE